MDHRVPFHLDENPVCAGLTRSEFGHVPILNPRHAPSSHTLTKPGFLEQGDSNAWPARKPPAVWLKSGPCRARVPGDRAPAKMELRESLGTKVGRKKQKPTGNKAERSTQTAVHVLAEDRLLARLKSTPFCRIISWLASLRMTISPVRARPCWLMPGRFRSSLPSRPWPGDGSLSGGRSR
jgi:hypothetical protein